MVIKAVRKAKMYLAGQTLEPNNYLFLFYVCCSQCIGMNVFVCVLTRPVNHEPEAKRDGAGENYGKWNQAEHE